MGLDAVEIVMAAEETFGIEIADEEAQEIRTPRQFYETVARKVRTVDPAVCLTQRAFYLLRRVMCRSTSIPRSQFRPDTPLDQIISREYRRSVWQQLRKDVGAVAWPKLKFPTSVSVPAGTVLLGMWAVIAVWLIKLFTVSAFVPIMVSVFVMIWVTYGVFVLLRPLQTSLGGQTVGTLAEHIVAFNPHLLAPASPEWNMERIRAVLRNIISEQLGIEPDFDDDADFVRDLGLS